MTTDAAPAVTVAGDAPLAARVVPRATAERERRPWIPVAYPTLVGGGFFLSLFVASGASPFATTRMILVSVAACLVVSAASGALMRDRHRGGLLALAVILILITGNNTMRLAAILIGIAALAVERIASRRRPSRLSWPLVTRLGNMAGVILLLAVGIKAAQDGTLTAIVDDVHTEGPAFIRPPAAAPAFIAPVAAQRPDIYVVLLDGYLRPDKQASLFGHDDSAFVDALEGRGFDVAARSRSNYLLTILSLSSALNMRHLTDQTLLATLPASDVRHVRAARRLLNDNEVFRELHAQGYETVALSPGFEEVALRDADRFIDTGQLNEVEVLTFRQTLLGELVSSVAPNAFADSQRARIDATFAAAASVAAEPHDRPRFVFIHVPSPHAPVVFDAAGGPVAARDLRTFYEESGPVRGLTRAQFGAAYSGQIEYLNRKAVGLVDAILGANRTPPVILVMSDHGSASALDFADPEHGDLDERSSNLFAAFTPGHDGMYGDDITLVNVFGRLLDAYFGTSHPAQPDTLYRWTGSSVFNLVAVPPFASATP
ncbi:MAG: hypothetical protein ACJ77B_11955 [Chloroflexota bacterium]